MKMRTAKATATTTMAVWTLLSDGKFTSASSDFHPNAPTSHLAYLYSEIDSTEYSDIAETNHEQQQQQHESQATLSADLFGSLVTPNPPRLDDTCYHISGHAIMCHGGDDSSSHEPGLYVDSSILNHHDSDRPREWNFYQEENEQEDEEDDDDNNDEDDDGHSSMLSNSAIYRKPRTRVGAGMGSSNNAKTTSSYYASSTQSAKETSPIDYSEGQVRSQSQVAFVPMAKLSLSSSTSLPSERKRRLVCPWHRVHC